MISGRRYYLTLNHWLTVNWNFSCILAIGDHMHSLHLILYWFIYYPRLLLVYHDSYFAAQLCNQWDPNLWSLLLAIWYWMYIQVVHVSYFLRGVIFNHAKKSDFLGVNATPKVGVHNIVASISLQIWSELYSTVFTVFSITENDADRSKRISIIWSFGPNRKYIQCHNI